MFDLAPELQRDTLPLGDLPLCTLLLMNDAHYPWFILVPRVEAVSEVFQLDAADQARLWKEAGLLAEQLKDGFSADKMNIATLGNMVPQLHVHVIARKKNDAAWPGPVWGRFPAQPYDEAAVVAIRERLRTLLPDSFKPWESAQ